MGEEFLDCELTEAGDEFEIGLVLETGGPGQQADIASYSSFVSLGALVGRRAKPAKDAIYEAPAQFFPLRDFLIVRAMRLDRRR